MVQSPIFLTAAAAAGTSIAAVAASVNVTYTHTHTRWGVGVLPGRYWPFGASVRYTTFNSEDFFFFCEFFFYFNFIQIKYIIIN